MKMNYRSIKFKLLSTGLLSVLLPLLVIGYFSVSRSSSALTTLSKDTAQTMAVDLAFLVTNLVHAESSMALSFARDKEIISILEQVSAGSSFSEPGTSKILYENLHHKFLGLGDMYQGLFVTNEQGAIISGFLSGGGEYKKILVADNEDFKKAKQSGEVSVGEMLVSKATSQLVVPISAPVLSENKKFLGAIGIVLKADYFTSLVANRKIGKTGYAYMINNKGVIIAHPKAEHILKLDVTSIQEMKGINTLMLSGKNGVEDYVFKGTKKIAGYAPLGFNGWSIAVTQDADEFLSASKDIRNLNLVVSAIALGIVSIVLLISTRNILGPINAAVAGLKDIAQGEGDLTMRLQVKSKDEVGELAQWFNLFIEKLQYIIKDVASGVNTLSSSSTELTLISEQMNLGAQDASNKSNTVAVAAEEMSANMNNVAAAMEQSSMNTNLVATASEEMSSTISEIAQNAEKARSISENASKKATEASVNINELGESAKSIGKIVETITDISDQVNLLALNATIEAARAGEAGKGFAVVANEIKELAKQTAASSSDIKEKVSSIQNITEKTVMQIAEINDVISNVNEVVIGIATAVEEQTAATSEISSNVSQMAQGVQEVNGNVSQSSCVATEIAKDIIAVSSISSEMLASSAHVNSSAQSLTALAGQLNQMVGQFKTA